ncbi:hypothetical protein ACFCXK_31890 [Streptomyces sp. NPDC056269]|uniref:hypothetical protein n=1 Tax=Streptomyces sp. NPDC056269 TaxID=3345768 RepID=UPI0035DA7857
MSKEQLLTPEQHLLAAKRGLGLPITVVICGSTDFMAEMIEAHVQETVAGRIVVRPGFNMKEPHPLWADPADAENLKYRLADLHQANIRLADEVLIVNVRPSSPLPRSPRAVRPVLRSASTALCHPQG